MMLPWPIWSSDHWRTRMVLLDVGVHIGECVLLGVTSFGLSQVYTVESVPEMFRLLEKNMRRKRFARVHTRV